jgi:hypothetical protein
MRTKTPLILVTIIVLTLNLHAATYFVRPGASGNGTSWANAWGSPGNISWSTLNAGDMVCIAGGTYTGSISTGKSGTAGNPITIKRATSSDGICGSTTTGWSSAFDAQVIFSGGAAINIVNSYVTIDGMVPNGIYVTMQNNSSRFVGVGNFGASATSNVTVRYVEVAGPCLVSEASCVQNSDHVALEIYGSQGVQSNWLVQYLNLHGSCMNALLLNVDGLIWEHSRLADSWDNSGKNCHPNVIQVNGYDTSQTVTFRYNEVTNWDTEGIMFLGAATYYVYGNVWHDPANGSYPRLASSQTTNAGLILYNNTFVNMGSYGTITKEGGTWASTTQGRNNIWWNVTDTGSNLPNGDYDFSNQSTGETNGKTTSTSPFVDVNAHTIAGYHLAQHISSGLNIGAPYNIDYDGNTRATWDRGAFEYNNGSTAPNPPQGLAAVVR